ncbi:MAG: Uncharacterized MFS-type transporter, partial [uncultured Ramlibacter sp.]
GAVPARGAEPGRAQARGVRLGDVRLRQFGLHHGGHHRRLRRLLRRRHRGKGGLGHVRLDRGAQHLVRHRDAHHAEHRGLRRPSSGEEADPCAGDTGVRREHRCPGVRGAGFGGAGHAADHRFQHLLQLWRVTHRRLPAGAGTARGHGEGERMGLGLRLLRRHAGPGHLPGLRAVGAAAGHSREPVRSRDHGDHGGSLWRGGAGHFPVAEGARPAPARGLARRRPARFAGAPATDVCRGAALPRLHVVDGLRRVLPGRRGGCRGTRRDLRGAGDRLPAAGDHGPDLRAEPGRCRRRVRVGLPAGPGRPQAGLGQHAGGLGRHLRDRGPHHDQGRLLVGRRHRRPVHGVQPVGRPGDGRHVRATEAVRGILRAVDLRHPPGQHHRPADLRCDHLGHGRQPAH